MAGLSYLPCTVFTALHIMSVGFTPHDVHCRLIGALLASALSWQGATGHSTGFAHLLTCIELGICGPMTTGNASCECWTGAQGDSSSCCC